MVWERGLKTKLRKEPKKKEIKNMMAIIAKTVCSVFSRQRNSILNGQHRGTWK